MLDFTLHGWDCADALGLERPHVVGHSMGGMIAAEMCAVDNRRAASLSLIAPAGMWLDEYPIADIFGVLPFELPGLLFHDPVAGAALLTGGMDFTDPEALVEFFIRNARQLGTAGKMLFPIPNRRLSKRIYRLTAPTLLVWGESDKLIPPVYAERWQELVPARRPRHRCAKPVTWSRSSNPTRSPRRSRSTSTEDPIEPDDDNVEPVIPVEDDSESDGPAEGRWAVVRVVVLRTALVAGVIFALIQLVPYGWWHDNPPVISDAPWPDAASEQIARTSCYSCHSNETEWPIYSYVAPMSWLVRYDVERGVTSSTSPTGTPATRTMRSR